MSPRLASTPVATDLRIDLPIRSFLAKVNQNADAFWEWPQPEPQRYFSQIQSQTPVDMSGVTCEHALVEQDGIGLSLRVMKPERLIGTPGLFLFAHGGVWIIGNFDNHQRLLRDLVVQSGQIGVFVEYTSLPEARFPTQIEECFAALKWVSTHAGSLGGNGQRIAVAGNSVGGNLAAAVSLVSKDRQGPRISFQLLLVPATDASIDTESYAEYGHGRFLPREFMKYGWDLYVPDLDVRDNRYVSPLRARLTDLSGLPPALIITAENDPLRDEGEAYARKLKSAGVRVTAVRYNGTIHDFVVLNALSTLPATLAALRQAGDGLRTFLQPQKGTGT